MDVAARHRSGGMAEHRRDRQFRIAQFACDAPERMPERVRRYIGPSESVANSAQHSISRDKVRLPAVRGEYIGARSEEHTSELQSLMRISYAVFCLKNKINITHRVEYTHTRNSMTIIH